MGGKYRYICSLHIPHKPHTTHTKSSINTRSWRGGAGGASHMKTSQCIHETNKHQHTFFFHSSAYLYWTHDTKQKITTKRPNFIPCTLKINHKTKKKFTLPYTYIRHTSQEREKKEQHENRCLCQHLNLNKKKTNSKSIFLKKNDICANILIKK